MEPTPNSLSTEIAAFIEEPDERFASLALSLFAHQFAHNPPYRAYCEALGVDPGRLASWEQIPAIPADAFKSGLPLACFPPGEAARVFLTSGTTTEVRGAHYVANLDLYRLAVRRGWEDAGLPGNLDRLFLCRPPGATPDSSLATMFEFLADDAGDPPWLLDEDGALDRGRLDRALRDGKPLLLFATALAFLEFCESMTDPLPLPTGSFLFQTGGYKGLAKATAPGDIRKLAADWLGLPPERIINEYGMTELSSQCYAVGPDGPHRAPPWMRVRVIDPESGREQPRGESGYLVFHDLANVHSVLAVRTQDFGRAIDHHSFFLEGRDPGALPRGCSRSSETGFPTLARP